MKKSLLRLCAVLLSLLFLPFSSFADGHVDEPLYRSDFTFRIWMNADAFPDDGAFHYKDWETLLSKLSIHGTMDFQRPMDFEDNYIRMEANLRLNNEDTLPFRFQSYGVSRYLTTPALKGDSLFFYMLNFFQFMLKPYYFMNLPTNLLSVIAAPDLSLWTVNQFLDKWQQTMGDSTHLDYKRFLRKVNLFSRKINNKRYMIYYFLITNALGLIYGNNAVYDDLTNLNGCVKCLDPDRKGYNVSTQGDTTSYTIGDTTVLTVTGKNWHFYLPDPNGYVFDLCLTQDDNSLLFTLSAVLNGEDRLKLAFSVDGMALDENLTREGNVSVQVSGNAIKENFSREEYKLQLHYRHQFSSMDFPRNESFELSCDHPVSGLPAFGMQYEAQTEIAPSEEIVNDNGSQTTLGDFFGMNSDVLETMKQKYIKPLIGAFLPFLPEIPLGVYSDAYAVLKQSGFLAMLGIEGIN